MLLWAGTHKLRIDYYNDGEGSWEKTGHFTQVVWKGTKEVGFGYAGGYVVGSYFPAGNMMGDFQGKCSKALIYLGYQVDKFMVIQISISMSVNFNIPSQKDNQ